MSLFGTENILFEWYLSNVSGSLVFCGVSPHSNEGGNRAGFPVPLTIRALQVFSQPARPSYQVVGLLAVPFPEHLGRHSGYCQRLPADGSKDLLAAKVPFAGLGCHASCISNASVSDMLPRPDGRLFEESVRRISTISR